MTADIQGITDSNPVELLSDRELAEETLRVNRRIETVLSSLDGTLAKFLAEFSRGGARGLRTAIREHASGR